MWRVCDGEERMEARDSDVMNREWRSCDEEDDAGETRVTTETKICNRHE